MEGIVGVLTAALAGLLLCGGPQAWAQCPAKVLVIGMATGEIVSLDLAPGVKAPTRP